VDASVIADPVLSDAGSAINAFSLLPGAPMTITGRCSVGQFIGEAQRPGCHARVLVRECQYLGPAAETVNTCFRTATFTVTADQHYPSVADSGNQMHRRFCPSCGTPLFSEAEARPHLIFVRVGTFDDPSRHLR